jgi:peptidoglycan/LPS O-acetylase OafA/YrhL
MAEREDTGGGVGRTIAGLVLIVAAAPVFMALIPGHTGWTVILGGLAALGALVAGILLAGRWLGVFQRRRENPLEQQQGCLQLLVTLLALLAGAAILYYVVYYGAGAYLRGEIGLLLP